ncbi:hypothetical protein ON010_g10698 [Phytophthora cinnamomi]|nr:hypothetical protein ON010_g10698 [Phytophthora cinnamomi]
MENYVDNPSPSAHNTYQEAKPVYTERKEHVARLQQDSAFNFHAGSMETSTSAFFRPPISLLRPVQVTTGWANPAFYQTSPEVFGKILYRVFQFQLDQGILLPSQRKSCVTLLYKKGDWSDPGNYRSITPMPVDAKVLSKITTSSSTPTNDLQHHATTTSSEAMALFLDFEKAYDRVIWEYLFLIRAILGFCERFISWIRLLYNKPLALILLNGFLLQPLQVTRSVKQGDPLSSLLFLLCIEPPGNLIRQRQDLGVPVNVQTTITGLYFADDSTLIATNPNRLRQQLEQRVRNMGSASENTPGTAPTSTYYDTLCTLALHPAHYDPNFLQDSTFIQLADCINRERQAGSNTTTCTTTTTTPAVCEDDRSSREGELTIPSSHVLRDANTIRTSKPPARLPGHLAFHVQVPATCGGSAPLVDRNMEAMAQDRVARERMAEPSAKALLCAPLWI